MNELYDIHNMPTPPQGTMQVPEHVNARVIMTSDEERKQRVWDMAYAVAYVQFSSVATNAEICKEGYSLACKLAKMRAFKAVRELFNE